MPDQVLFFIRHAETALKGTFCGQTDPPLNDAGRAQLAPLAARLRGEAFTTIVSSDLRRAQQTAAALAEPRGLPVQTTASLREIHFGEWEALDWPAIEARDPAFAQEWISQFPALTPPGGEAVATFRARILAEIDRLRHLSAAAAGPVGVVTHAGVLRVLLEDIGHFSAHHAWERTRDYTAVLRCTQASPHSRIDIGT